MSSPGHPSSTSFFQKAVSCAVGSAIIWRTNLVGQLSARKRLAASRSISCSSENPKSNLRASVLSMGILRLKPLRSMFQVPLRLSDVQAPGMPSRGLFRLRWFALQLIRRDVGEQAIKIVRKLDRADQALADKMDILFEF